MNRLIHNALLVVLFAAAAGCGGRPAPAPADPAKGREALQIALDAWKKGETADTLQKRSPPIHFTDLNWREGARLLDYKIEAGEEYHGSQLRATAVLTLQDANGNRSEKKTLYYVDTHPALVIVPGDP